MTESEKDAYVRFVDEIAEILGLAKPVDVLRLCAVTDDYLKPFQARLDAAEKLAEDRLDALHESFKIQRKLLDRIEKMKCCDNCNLPKERFGEPCAECIHHSKWEFKE